MKRRIIALFCASVMAFNMSFNCFAAPSPAAQAIAEIKQTIVIENKDVEMTIDVEVTDNKQESSVQVATEITAEMTAEFGEEYMAEFAVTFGAEFFSDAEENENTIVDEDVALSATPEEKAPTGPVKVNKTPEIFEVNVLKAVQECLGNQIDVLGVKHISNVSSSKVTTFALNMPAVKADENIKVLGYNPKKGTWEWVPAVVKADGKVIVMVKGHTYFVMYEEGKMPANMPNAKVADMTESNATNPLVSPDLN